MWPKSQKGRTKMKNEQGKKIAARTMTKKDAVPYLQKVLKSTKGKKRRRALEIAISAVEAA